MWPPARHTRRRGGHSSRMNHSSHRGRRRPPAICACAMCACAMCACAICHVRPLYVGLCTCVICTCRAWGRAPPAEAPVVRASQPPARLYPVPSARLHPVPSARLHPVLPARLHPVPSARLHESRRRWGSGSVGSRRGPVHAYACLHACLHACMCLYVHVYSLGRVSTRTCACICMPACVGWG